MPTQESISNYLLLPELKLVNHLKVGKATSLFVCHKYRTQEFCIHCASGENKLHDYRWVCLKDEPVRGKYVLLKIRKRRLKCLSCGKVFTEPVQGVLPRKRLTQRFKKAIYWACEKFKDLKSVSRYMGCSSHTVYTAYYDELRRKVRQNLNYEWPKAIGIDEHGFSKSKEHGGTVYASMVVDHTHKRNFEVIEGRSSGYLVEALEAIPGRKNVLDVTLDFPNAKITADKFHVLRLLNNSILRSRKEITGTNASKLAKKLLLMNNTKLNLIQRDRLWVFLDQYPKLKELYRCKEALHALYRKPSYKEASKYFTRITDLMGLSKLKEIRTLRRTLMKWREEILNYFKTKLTNARVEAHNNLAKLLKRNAFGFKNFGNYRLRVLNSTF